MRYWSRNMVLARGPATNGWTRKTVRALPSCVPGKLFPLLPRPILLISLDCYDCIPVYHCLLAGLDNVVDGLVALLGDLGHEVEVNELALVRGPFAVRVAVVDDLVRSGVTELGGGV